MYRSYGLGQKLRASLAGGVDMTGIVYRALALAGVCSGVTLPYFYYLIFSISGNPPWQRPDDGRGLLLLTQLLVLFLVCFLSGFTGFFFSRRLGLPGFGNLSSLRHSLRYLLPIGLLMALLSYCLFDRYFYPMAAVAYPNGPINLFFFGLKGAVTEETIIRFGLLTLVFGLLKRQVPAIVLVSALGAFLTLKYTRFCGVELESNYLLVSHFLLSFALNAVLGYIFVSRGLIHAMCLKFIFAARYVMAWVLLG